MARVRSLPHLTDSYALHVPEVHELARFLVDDRILEIGGYEGTGITSDIVALVLSVQATGELVAWVQSEGISFYPPDVARAGVDLDSLLVVHVPANESRDLFQLTRATELLLRSGAWGLVVLDLSRLGATNAFLFRSGWQTRLQGLVRHHRTPLVLLRHSDTTAPSLGPLISLRIQSRRVRISPGRFSSEPSVLKDKLGLGITPKPEGRLAPCGLL